MQVVNNNKKFIHYNKTSKDWALEEGASIAYTLRRLIWDWATKGLSIKPPEASRRWQFLNLFVNLQ
ncbi:hypothetical protein BKI52_23715 [marine bacterium AO1-C]|nr:hypothetical protein BKI52_23715 [marine bacterium AO1-C]